MSNFLKQQFSSFIHSNRTILYLYYKLFLPKDYSALKDYKFTDERLKFIHLLEAVNYCRVALIPQVYFEFGCHSARTFSSVIRAANYFQMDKMKFYAFDSFEGLPATDVDVDGVFQTGEFNTPVQDFLAKVKKKAGRNLSSEYVIKGYYSDSLTLELQKKMPKVGIVHIDVDLYSSTRDVLNFLKPLMIVGTLILFDDYYCFPPDSKKGEMRAILEFCENNPSFQVKEWKAYSTFGQSFFVISVPAEMNS